MIENEWILKKYTVLVPGTGTVVPVLIIPGIGWQQYSTNASNWGISDPIYQQV